MNVSEAMSRLMKAYGARHVFTLTGAPQDALIRMQNHEGIHVVLARSERSAFAMADAYARLTGKPTFGLVQFGPGASYLPPSLVDAFWAKSPVIAVSGSMNTRTRYRYEYQEIEQAAMVSPMTKWSGELPAPDRIVDVLRTAIRAAVSGVPGPVYLGIPHDFLSAPLSPDPEIRAEPAFLRAPATRVLPEKGAVEAILSRLARSRRPLIFAGGGVLTSEAWDELVSFAESLGIPVVTSISGKGAIAEVHRLAVGVAGRYSRKVANDVLADCDTCLVIGSRLGSMATDIFRLPRPETHILHVDLDPMTLGCNYREEVSVVADAKAALAHLRKAALDSGLDREPHPWESWTLDVRRRVAEWRSRFHALAQETTVEGRINPRYLLFRMNEHVRGDDVVVADTGYMAGWAGALIEQKEAGRNTLRAAGSLGWGFPAALGAQLAVGERRRVFCLTGDGGLGYHLADLETALRLGLPVTTIVMNNACLAFEYHVQKYLHREICSEASDFLDVDFAAVARSMGAHGERVLEPEELEPALRRAGESGKPAVVDVVVSREIPAPATRYEAVLGRDL